MSQIKPLENEVTLSDLNRLGYLGGATARLEDGRTIQLHHRHGTIRQQGYVAGELRDVDVIVEYSKIYSQIRTIKQNNILIARRGKVTGRTALLLTGRGYRRPVNSK
ncbi:hypothetical protein [Streptococcus suis]|uniref:hypothetical protein n=1 Tax=Streptococcus suis TaxID=1307 RepID=UPI003B9DF786